jgi:hypothetical protein
MLMWARLLSVPLRRVNETASQTCLSLIPSAGRVFGPKKVLGSPPEELERSKRAWEALSRFGFVYLLDDKCVVFVDPPEVPFTWGGALPGHWGIHVLASSSGRAPLHYVQTVRFSDRIVLLSGH